MTKVLITGASGFIGRRCLAELAAKGYEVHALTRQWPAAGATPQVCWHEVDLLKQGTSVALLRDLRPEYLLHLAWYAEPGKFWEARENIGWVRASLELLSAFAESGGRRIVAAGTCAEYDLTVGECDEYTTPLQPNTLYGASKHALERILHFSQEQTGLSCAWGRIFFLYGPYEHPSRIVAYVVNSLLKGELALCSEGTQTLDFMHVEDAASAFVSLLESDTRGPVNIGSGQPAVLRKVIEEIGRQIGRPELIQLGARGAGANTRIWANVDRLTNELKFKPRYNLFSGIEQTIEWWRTRVGSRNSSAI